jgi:hypothetical protein
MEKPRDSQTGSQTPRGKSRRRWFQFGLSTLLIVTALAAGGALAFRMYVEPYRRQRETMAMIAELGGSYKTAEADKWLRRLFGEDFVNVVSVDLAACDEPDRYIEQVASLPALETLIVGGPGFADEHMRRLQAVTTLRKVMLDCTEVTEPALAELRQRVPEVVVYDYRAIFDALLRDLLTAPSHESERDFYGTLGDKQFALFTSAGQGVPWRKSYRPQVEGFEARHVDEGARIDSSSPRLLGIRLDVFDLDAKAAPGSPFSARPIQVTVFNAGGNGGQPAPIGGCMVFYDLERKGDRWTVKYISSLDP